MIGDLSTRSLRGVTAPTHWHGVCKVTNVTSTRVPSDEMIEKDRNRERLATIGQFVAILGHELRSPLAVIESSLFLVRQHLGGTAAVPPKVAKHLDRIGTEVDRSNNIIHHLLDLARDRPPHLQRVALRSVVDSALEAIELLKGVAVTTEFPDDLEADVDPDQLRQVLLNLFSNASQAMNGGGRIRVLGERLPDGTVTIRVGDDGPGIPAEVRHRVFEALFTTRERGTGLGLALCRRILEAHGGTIEVETMDSGASILLTLPPGRGRLS